MIGLIIIGILLVALGVYLAVFQRAKSANVALEMQVQPTKTFEEVKEALEAMQEYNPAYRELVEVKGYAASSEAVKTPYTNRQVAFYTAETVQVSETTEEYRDSDGNRRMRTTKHEDKLSEEESSAELILKDNAGNEIVIETRGIASKLDLVKTHDMLETQNNQNPAYLNDPFRIYRKFNPPSYGTGHRILGYKRIEKTFPLNGPLYVLGEAYMVANRIYIGPPKDKKQPFIVTTKSEEQMLKETQSSQTTSTVVGIICAVLGLVLTIVGFTKK
ncbi:MAG: hypothetical protein IKN17_00500 [Ruminococcus sp.]|nr:hypothetical protein [Ruminococcus sp.]